MADRFDINCLRELPASMVNLSRLEELSLTNNFFATFPEFAMKMSNLKKVTKDRLCNRKRLMWTVLTTLAFAIRVSDAVDKPVQTQHIYIYRSRQASTQNLHKSH